MTQQTLEKVREFVRRSVIGKEAWLDSFPEPPADIFAGFHEQGLANWWLPQAYGGLGISVEDSVDIVSELAYGDAGVAFTLFISCVSTLQLQLFGRDALRDRLLSEMTKHGGFSAALGSEKEAGSDLLRTATSATVEGDQVVLNGRKFFSTNSAFADFLVILCSLPDEERFIAVVVPKGTPGVIIERRWPVIGLRSSGTYEVTLDDCRVPATMVLDVNGVRSLEAGLNMSRILIAASAIGVGRRIRDLCLEYGKAKIVQDKPLLQHPVFGAKLGQMEADLETIAAVCKTAARELDRILLAPDAAQRLQKTGTLKSAMVAKLVAGQLGWRIASTASEMFGGVGYTHESLMSKLMRDVRYVSIVEGGEDVVRAMIYSRYVLRRARD